MTAPAPTWPDLLATLLDGRSLEAAQTGWAMSEIMDGAATPARLAGFVIALRAKGETADEVAGFVTAMFDHAALLEVPESLRVRAVDTCGTGGDRAHTVNLSTMAALVVAGAGVPVVKHGNRAASSACGSADLLEELGVVVDLAPEAAARCFEKAGAVFCFAPVFHPAMRFVGPARRELGVATVFNVLGPLCNPARPGAQALGVADARLAPVMAQVLAARGTRGMVFRGDDGLDELTTATTSRVWVITGDGRVREDVLDPTALGLARSEVGELRGADRTYNATVTREFLAGAGGPVRDAVLLAAAASLVAAEGPTGAPIGEQIGGQLARAAQAVDSGAAAAALDRWAAASREA